MNSTHRPPLAAILVVPLVAALILILFAWPSAKVGPRDLPVGVVGAQPFAAPGFEVHRYASEAAARDAIEDREVYGALTGSKVLVASAASAPVAQMLTHAAEGRPVEDVVPAVPGLQRARRVRAAARARRRPHRHRRGPAGRRLLAPHRPRASPAAC